MYVGTIISYVILVLTGFLPLFLSAWLSSFCC